jgi:hypothetical protein
MTFKGKGACMMKILIFTIMAMVIKAFPSDSRSMSDLDKVQMPIDSAPVDSTKTISTRVDETCDTAAILEKFSPKFASKHFFLESGLLFNPTTFSYDFSTDTEHFKTYAHPSFFLSPGVRGTFIWGANGISMSLFYKGAYDFYLGSETSGPVISRLQNPGILVAYSRDTRFGIFNGFETAVEFAHNAIKSSFPDDYVVQDFASMGWNYFAPNLTLKFKFGDWKINGFVSLKTYMNQSSFRLSPLEDSSLFYLGPEKPHIWQYDGVLCDVSTIVPTDFFLLRYIHLPGLPWTYGAINIGFQAGSIQSGSITEMFNYPSYHATLKGRWWQFPWIGFVTIERGYANPIAFYSLRTWTTRLGMELNDFKYVSHKRKRVSHKD